MRKRKACTTALRALRATCSCGSGSEQGSLAGCAKVVRKDVYATTAPVCCFLLSLLLLPSFFVLCFTVVSPSTSFSAAMAAILLLPSCCLTAPDCFFCLLFVLLAYGVRAMAQTIFICLFVCFLFFSLVGQRESRYCGKLKTISSSQDLIWCRLMVASLVFGQCLLLDMSR